MNDTVNIKLTLADAYLADSKPLLEEFDNEVNPHTQYCDSRTGYVNTALRFLQDWDKFDVDLSTLVDRLRDNPYLKELVFVFNGADGPYIRDGYVTTLVDDNGKIQRIDLSDHETDLMIEYEPGIFIGSVVGSSDAERDRAFSTWVTGVRENTPRDTVNYSLSRELAARYKGIGVGLEDGLDVSIEEMVDGSAKVTLSIHQGSTLGVALKVAGLEAGAGAGLEGGYMLVHDFPSVAAAELYLEELKNLVVSGLRNAVVAGPSFSIFGPVVTGAGTAIAGAVSAANVAKQLLDPDSLESVIASVEAGSYWEFAAGIKGLASFGAWGSFALGYKRDFVADENIVYFGGEVESEFNILGLGRNSGLMVEGAYHDGPSGSYVILDLEVDASLVGKIEGEGGLGAPLDLSAGVKGSVGGMLSIQARLDFNDDYAMEAWNAFLNPFDRSLDLGAVFHESSLVVQVSEIAEVGVEAGVGLDANPFTGISTGAEMSVVEHSVLATWAKHQQGTEFHAVSGR